MLDDTNMLIRQMDKFGWQLDLKFDILCPELVKNIKKFGCKVLHLSPKLNFIEENAETMIIEDHNLNEIKITP